MRAESNRFVAYHQTPSFSLECSRPLQLSIDGESYRDTKFEFQVVPNALSIILGSEAPLAD